MHFITEPLGYLEIRCDPVQNSISFGQDIETDSLCDILTQISGLCHEMSFVLSHLAHVLQHFDHTPMDESEWRFDEEFFMMSFLVYPE